MYNYLAAVLLTLTILPSTAANGLTGVAAWKAHAAKMELKFELPVGLLVSICAQESGWRNGITGAAGEVGICQIKMATAKMVCVNCKNLEEMLQNPYTNLMLAAMYLSFIKDNISGDPDVMAAAYNGGHAHAVVKYMAQVRDRRNALLHGRRL